MLPCLLADAIQSTLTQFHTSAFEPAEAFSHGVMSHLGGDVPASQNEG